MTCFIVIIYSPSTLTERFHVNSAALFQNLFPLLLFWALNPVLGRPLFGIDHHTKGVAVLQPGISGIREGTYGQFYPKKT